MTRQRDSFGFTIIELLVVVSIIAIIISLIVSAGLNMQAIGMEKDTQGHLEVIATAVEEYREQTGAYPRGSSGALLMRKLLAEPACKELLRGLPERMLEGRDAFDKNISFTSTGGKGGTAAVRSGGRDGRMGTADDLSSADQ